MNARPTVEDFASPSTDARRGVIHLPDGGVTFEARGLDHGGDAVLLLRPLAGSMALWGEFRDLLAARFRVFAFDPLGVGTSGAAPLDGSTRSMARDAVAVLAALEVSRAHVFGISLGAMVATWIAIDAPERVARLCLASAGPVGFVLSPMGVAHGVEAVEAMLAPDEAVVARLTESVMSRAARAEEPGLVESVERAAADEPARRIEVVKHALAAACHDARSELHRITAPTLVLAGERDEVIGMEPPRALAEAIAGARFEVIADAGHDLTLEQPGATAVAVDGFFRGEPTG